MPSHLRISLTLLVSLVLIACGGDGGSTLDPVQPGATLATVSIAPDGGSLVPQQTVQFAATPRDSQGAPVAGGTVTWSSSADAVATVSPSGLVSGISPGQATITATIAGRTARVTVDVVEGGLVGPSGGMVTAFGGAVTLQIRPGALSDITPIVVTAMSNVPSHPRMVPGTGYRLAPEATTLGDPATVGLRWTPAQLPPGAGTDRLRVHRHDGSAWSPLPEETVDASMRIAAGETGRLGVFALIELEAAPTPEVTGLVPKEIPAHGGGFQLIVEGTGFTQASVVQWNGADRATTHESPTRLVAAIRPGDVTLPGTAQVAVVDPGTGGTSGSVLEFVIGSPVVGETVSVGHHRCGVTETGAALCWGSNIRWALGTGDTLPRFTPDSVVGGGSFAMVSAGEDQTCALTAAGEAWCWGSNASGQLGNEGAGLRSLAPVAVLGGHRFTTLSSGSRHICGITPSGTGLCWGNGTNGRLGTGDVLNRSEPTPVAGGRAFRSVAAGTWHTCAVTTAGDAFCWGQGRLGVLGTGSTSNTLLPAPVAGNHPFASIAVHTNHSCGVTTDGAALCWGFGGNGQLGDRLSQSDSVPRRVAGGQAFRSVDLAFDTTCGVTTSNTGLCWGGGSTGLIGDGGATARALPTPVAGGHAFARISVDGQACGVRLDGAVYCWGTDAGSTLGDGRTHVSPVPIPVAGGNRFAVDAAMAASRR
jgi:hypothetical protein